MLSIYLSTGTLIYSIILAAICGMVLGSFLNCVALRIGKGENFIKGRSHCMNCGHELGVLDLFPVFSWLFLKGRCRYCKEKISARYPITEAIMGIVVVLILLRFDLTIEAFLYLIFACCMFCLSLVDFDTMTIPNGTLIISLAVWLCYSVYGVLTIKSTWMDMLWHFVSGVVYGGGLLLISVLFDKVFKKESLGGGDVKLFFVVGIYLGFLPTLLCVILSCIIGLAFALVGKKKRDESGAGPQFPFGPAISIATIVTALYGTPIVDWYLSLFI